MFEHDDLQLTQTNIVVTTLLLQSITYQTLIKPIFDMITLNEKKLLNFVDKVKGHTEKPFCF